MLRELLQPIILIGIAIFVVLIVPAYLLINHMIFYPPSPAGYQKGPNVIFLTTADNKKIAAVYLPNPTAKYTLLISHGNAEDIGYMMPYLLDVQAHGFAVFAYDYHGYGLSGGKPSEKNTYLDIQAAYDYLTAQLKIQPKRIILLGRSLGSAAAIHLAQHETVAGLILESPFVSVYRVATRIKLLPFDKFKNLDKIKNIRYPVLVIHGLSDRTVAPWHGQRIFRAANHPKQAYWVEGAGHNNIMLYAGNTYWAQIELFIKRYVDKR